VLLLLRDAIVVTVGDCLTSIFAGVVIFAIIGFMAKEMGVDVGEVATQGESYICITYRQSSVLAAYY